MPPLVEDDTVGVGIPVVVGGSVAPVVNPRNPFAADLLAASASAPSCCTVDQPEPQAPVLNSPEVDVVTYPANPPLPSGATQASEASLSAPSAAVCSICYDHGVSAVYDPCGHSACRECGQNWFAKTGTCHQCRVPVTKVIPLFL
jgi:hypothetical protein